MRALLELARRHRAGERLGIHAVCSAHPLVLRAALQHAQVHGTETLIEATSNQVNQHGGYTGLRPAGFRDVVYRTADQHWTDELAQAAVVTTSDAARALLAGAATDGINAVDVYVAPVELVDGRPQPANLRERIRRGGPTFPLPGAASTNAPKQEALI